MEKQLIVHFPSYKLGTMRKPFVEPGRNRPCPCGSGKKYKHCCLDKYNSKVRAMCVEASRKNRESGEVKK